MKIEVLGPGCKNCERLAKNVQEALVLTALQAEVVKVEEMFAIMGKGVNRTPGLIIDGQLKVQGRVATVDEIVGWLSA